MWVGENVQKTTIGRAFRSVFQLFDILSETVLNRSRNPNYNISLIAIIITSTTTTTTFIII